MVVHTSETTDRSGSSVIFETTRCTPRWVQHRGGGGRDGLTFVGRPFEGANSARFRGVWLGHDSDSLEWDGA